MAKQKSKTTTPPRDLAETPVPKPVARVRNLKRERSDSEYRSELRDDGVLEIQIFEPIDPFFGIGLEQISEDLNANRDAKAINVRIMSEGGDVFEAIGIYNELVLHPARVEVDIHIALSAAGIIAMAGDVVRMAHNGMFMIHKPWTIALGNDDELHQVADVLTVVGQSTVVETFVRKTGLTADRVTELMTQETWMGAEEAKKFGFIDEITGNSRAAAKFDREAWQARAHPNHVDKPNLDQHRSRLATMRMVTTRMQRSPERS